MLRTLNGKLIASSCLIVLLSGLAFALLSVKQNEIAFRTSLEGQLQAVAFNLSSDLYPFVGENYDFVEITTRLLMLNEYDYLKAATIFDVNGNTVHQFVGPAELSLESPNSQPKNTYTLKQQPTPLIENGNLYIQAPIGDGPRQQGTLQIVHDLDTPLRKSNTQLLLRSLPLALGIVLLFTVLAIWSNKYFLHPLQKLISFTESIYGSESLNKRHPETGEGEVSTLAKSINDLLTRIEEYTEKNKRYTEALEDKKQELEIIATIDALTGLPNRKYLNDILETALQELDPSRDELNALFLDLDFFKAVNDSLGHDIGDKLLIGIANTIKSVLRESDVAARFGGDEFVLLLKSSLYDAHDDAERVAQRIIDALSKPLHLGEWEVQTGVSIGIANASMAGFNRHALIRNADIAMYSAKDAGRNNYRFFEPSHQEASMRKLLIANAIPKAIAGDEFELYFQAKFDCKCVLVGFEALLRWNSQFDGAISPGEFIPIAEQTGKMIPITRWVIDNTCEYVKKVQALFGPNIHLSMNLSVFDISDPFLTAYISECFEKYAIKPGDIQFEITESAYLDNFNEAGDFFSKVRALGAGIALDDFGTGYSSLSYLTQLKICTLKIDQQFIRNANHSAKDKLIIETIIQLGRNLHLDVCAEGVETQEQLDYLAQSGCTHLQGNFLSYPCHFEELRTCLSQHIA